MLDITNLKSMENDKKLKPVTFISGKYKHHHQNTTQQIMLINALKITQDPHKLKELIGVKTVAEVYRTLDKMAMRKEYHAALARSGISFDYMVENLKNMIEKGFKDSDKLKALQILMKSIGMDKYEEASVSGGNWEDVILKAAEKEEEKLLPPPSGMYEVKAPEMPDSLKKIKDKEKDIGRGLYE